MSKVARGIMEKLFCTDQDLDAFCLDHFREIHRRFTLGMDRVQKENLLLQLADPEQLLALLVQQKNTKSRSKDFSSKNANVIPLTVLAQKLQEMSSYNNAVVDALNNLEGLDPRSLDFSDEDSITAINFHNSLRRVETRQCVMLLDEVMTEYAEAPSSENWNALNLEISDFADSCNVVLELLKTSSSHFSVEYDYLITRLEQGMIMRKKLIQAIAIMPPPKSLAQLTALKSISVSYAKLRKELIFERRILLRLLKSRRSISDHAAVR